ncbi:MAG: ATP-binding protein [Gammaproteobacteria bacterium]|nr:ATP-binding protein [Gammaproteobacteria bacterium]
MHKNADVLSDFINSIEAPLLFLSLDFVVLDLNIAAEKIFKLKRSSAIGKSFSFFCPYFNQTTEQLFSNNLISRIGKQKIIWLSLSSNLPSNEVKFILIGQPKEETRKFQPNIEASKNTDLSIHQDIKDLSQTLTGQPVDKTKSTIEHVKDIYHYMENIIAEVPISVYWMNMKCIYLGCSNSMAKLLNLKSRHDIVGKTYADLYDKKSAAHYKKADHLVMSTGVALSAEEPLYFPDGSKKTYLSNKVPLLSSNGKIIGMLGISVDITERKNMEENLLKAKEAAEAGEKAKTIFIANMSHDIRTPLTGVIGLGHILEDEIENPEQKEHAHNIAASGDALLDMLNQVITAVASGRLTTDDVHKEPFDLQLLIQSIVDLENSSVDFKDIELRTTIDERIPTILIGDHKKIYHVILNLVGNAIKFTKTGHVSINVTLAEKHNNSVQLLFKVSDTGSGIPAESLDKIFELFYRGTPSYKGLDKGHGVGLHIVKTYTELLGGKIIVNSKINEGSKFSFTIPLKIADQNAIPKNISEEPPLVDNSQKTPSLNIQTTIPEKTKTTAKNILSAPEVLVIEDNPIALSVAQSIVKQSNCNPTPATDGESALELAKTKPFDLILSDVGLPGISGIEFTEQLRKHEQEQSKSPVPIVAVTGHAEGKIHEECIATGMNDVIIKPINIQTLAKVCDKFSLFSENDDTLQPLNETTEDIPSKSVNPQNKYMLKADLPDTEAELFELDSLPIFDVQHAREMLGNDNVLLMKVLKDTINITIPEELPRMDKAHEEGNWQTVADISHKLKGGFLSISLTRAAIACQYLERSQKIGNTTLLEKLYQQVTKTIEETSDKLKIFVK